MLSVSGKCLDTDFRNVVSKKDGSIHCFNSALIYEKGSGCKPFEVNTYEVVLTPGKSYTIPVTTSIFGNGVQFNCIKNSPPQEVYNLSDKVTKS